MESPSRPLGSASDSCATDCEPVVRLRLYIAQSTPNSVRAEHNLAVALTELRMRLPGPDLEIVDFFTQPKRAITEGVVVTRALIGFGRDKRIVLMGDLANRERLGQALQDLMS